MLIATGHRKVQTNTMKAAYRKHSQMQYNYHQCQLGHVTPGNALLISVCILMLPVVQLMAEHVQLATTYYMNFINQWHVHQHHMNISHTPLLLSSLSNVLPAIVLQNSVIRAIGYPSYTSSHFSVRCIPPSQHLNLLSDLGRSVVAVVLALLMLLSGDIETNPGPLGQEDLKSLHSELHRVADKWYTLGVQLQVPVETLKCIEAEHNQMNRCLLEMLTVWLKCTTPPPTWSILTGALESPPVGERLLAQKLRDKYCQRAEERVTHDYPGEGLSSVGHFTPQGSYPKCASPYSMPPQLDPSNHPPWSARYYYSSSTNHPLSTELPPPPAGATSTTTPPTMYSQATHGPMLVTSPCLTTPMTVSTPYPVLPPSPSSLISDSTPPDTLPTPQPPTETPPPEHTVLLDRLSVEQHVKRFEDLFIELTDCTYDILVERGIDVHRLHARLISLNVSRKHEHQDFINNHLMNIDQGTTFNNLWARLGSYWNFLNFDLLEHIINKFGSEDLKQKMKSYKHDLQSFRKATRLCDFIDCWPVQGETPPEAELREFVAKMKHDWDNCTLEDLESLKGVITRKFFLPEFALLLKQIKEGCVVITWLIPVPFVKILQEEIENTSNEFFMEQMIEAITIGGQVSYRSAAAKHSGYLHEPSSSTPTVSITSPTLAETLHPVKPDVSKKETLSDFPTHLDNSFSPCSGDSSRSTSSGYSSFYSSVTPSPLFHHPTYASKPSSGYSIDQNPLTRAEKYVIKKCVDEIQQHVKLQPSAEQYLSKPEVEADPSLPTKYQDYLSSTPAIRAALYTTFNAKITAKVFSWSQHTKSTPPTTMTELLTAFTLKTLVDHLSTQSVYHKQQLKVTSFSDLPADMYRQFQGLCRMAYEGILSRQQLVFSAAHLPTGFAPLGLMQKIPQLYTEGRDSSYHFIHLTLQEYLAAVHISQLPVHVQAILIREHLDNGHFKMTMRYFAGLMKLVNMPPDITRRLMQSDNAKLSYFHFLFEAKDISVTTGTLCSDEMFVYSHYSWTPLDYYVTGHSISHSNCPWSLHFLSSFIDDEKFELFCQGCAAPHGTGCRGNISHAYFSFNDITSKSIQSFVNIPPHILQDMRVLHLNNNKLDGSTCDLLAKTVPSMSRLEDLSLSHNAIGTGGAVEVIKALCSSGVKQLWLYNTGIWEPDCEALCELLKSSHSLQDLHIHQNNLSSVSVASVITGLSHNSSLTTLNISNSDFSMANVNSLASILRDQSKCTLTMLWLRDCHIGEKGASELAAALCKNSTLKRLYLDHNSIGMEGASSVSDMLQHNTLLEALNLHDDSVGEEGVHVLINCLKYNQTLTELWLPWKYISETSDQRIQGWEWWF